MAGITFKNVVKTYDNGVTVVPDLNLEIKDKEFVVLVGPSGCGKSTTLRMIAGLESISDGELYIGDQLMNAVAPKNRNIAMVFQNYALYPHLSVYKNMTFALELAKVPKDEMKKKVEWAADILGLEHDNGDFYLFKSFFHFRNPPEFLPNRTAKEPPASGHTGIVTHSRTPRQLFLNGKCGKK